MADDRPSPREPGGQPASPVATSLDEGRELFELREWGRAYTVLSVVERESGLEVEDLQRLAVVAFLVGQEDRSIELWAKAHNECLRRTDRSRAARCAFWLGFTLVNTGEMARAGGWFARAERMLEGQPDCVERGYLMVMEAHQGLVSGDAEAVIGTLERSVEMGERFDDPDLITLARLGRGQAMLELGQIGRGVAALDEVMVAVTTDAVSPLVTGLVYCAVIVSYRDVFDVRRAQEWTAALSQWCDAQPDLVPYRGQCLVHRAEVMRLHGAWGDAMTEAQRACARLDGEPAVGDAYYERAELHRLVGEFTLAEEAYRDANRWGRSPQPGLALLRLAQSRLDAAGAAIRNALVESPGRLGRPRLLAASVEIALEAGDVAAARAAADELAGIADEVDAPLLHALAAHAQGAVLLAEGDAGSAQTALRRAWRAWQGLEAPYEAAQARVLMTLACRALGDHETANLELDAARWTFEHLGAKPDIARLEGLAVAGTTTAEHGLTRRELEVLTLVATGKTNREVASALVISEKTVARHVSNIFVKLGVSSRAAATAYSYEHGLVVRGRT